MRNSVIKFSLSAIVGVALFWGCSENNPKPPVITTGNEWLPQDVKVICPIIKDSFNKWFASGNATENGLVLPANSVTFPSVNNCSFYRWSEQMFLWMTSPVTPGGKTVLESPIFYDVTQANSSNKRFLIPHKPGIPLRVSSHIDQTGPNQLPVIIDTAGRLFEVEPAAPQTGAKAMLKNAAGKQVEVDHVEEAANGTHIFKDRAGSVIEHPKAVIRYKTNQARIVEEFKVGNKSVFIDSAGNEVKTEVGQATGHVLMAKNHSLVYYIMSVNDVYAFFLTACRDKEMSEFQFPTTAPARDSICAIARRRGVTLPDSNALALEIKTSWVETKGLANVESYVTIDAIVPTYDTSNPCKWIPNGEKQVKLALVGIHVVGSLAGHPEMSWATFEHQDNTPNAQYQYEDKDGNIKVMPRDTGTHWLFSSNASDTGVNHPHMKSSGDTINCIPPYTISASNTLQVMPWGSAFGEVTNPENGSSAASNSEVIAVNNAIRHMLMGKDVRKNYIMVGATWTSNGTAPNGKNYNSKDTVKGVAIGTSKLENSTMETYFQQPQHSCFFCHSRGNSLSPDSLSHIFSNLQPLPKVPASMNK